MNPVQIFLSEKTKSALFTLRNAGTQPLRLQLDVLAWDQGPRGESRLTPTADIAFFPRLLNVAPGEERKVRVGALTLPGSSEKTYRIFVEELPPLEKGDRLQEAAQVRVLTRVAIPIFLQPAKPRAQARVGQMIWRDGLVSFEVENTGTVHVVVRAIRVTGFGAAGEPVWDRGLQGWYVLAGGTRVYELELPKESCARLRTLAVEVEIPQTTLKERVETSPMACRP